MRMAPRGRREVYKLDGYEIHVVGIRGPRLRDAYHWLLRIPWWAAIGLIIGGYLGLNAVFAALYVASGGISNAAPGSFADAYFFSVQTMGTIGYGSMAPTTRVANAIVVIESVTGLGATALATGLVFVRFSRIRPRMVFSSRAGLAPMDGVPTLMIRVGNGRRSRIVDASFRLTLMRTVRTAEGMTVYRAVDLPLVREHAPALMRSWMVMHAIGPQSPLHGETAETLARSDAEITLAVTGLDETSLQPMHADHTWMHHDIVFGARLADVLSETPEGNVVLDLTRFHDLEPAPPGGGVPARRDADVAGPD